MERVAQKLCIRSAHMLYAIYKCYLGNSQRFVMVEIPACYETLDMISSLQMHSKHIIRAQNICITYSGVGSKVLMPVFLY